VDLVILVSNSDQRLDQNVLRNLLSQSDMMVCGVPKWTHTHSKKSLEIYSSLIFFLQAVRMTIFKNRSTNTNTQSFPFLVDGRQYMQSIEMDSQGFMGVGIGVYKTFLLMAGLEIAQTVQDLIYLPTSCRSFGQ
jgi:hypothetical protein